MSFLLNFNTTFTFTGLFNFLENGHCACRHAHSPTYIILLEHFSNTSSSNIQKEEFPAVCSSFIKPKLGFILASLPHPIATNVIKTP